MIRLGVIGMSEGNGHPYSWSAIINFYDREAMENCPFPVIPRYLEKQSYPDDFIKGARVTHVWTQDPALSQSIAAASKIDHIVSRYADMIGQVDAILLARDDWQNHETHARVFLEAGLPVYIDKPLANSVRGAEALFALEQYDGQIFSCSALRYMRELEAWLPLASRIRAIRAQTVKSWETYGIHIVEPMVRLLFPFYKEDSLSFKQSSKGASTSLKLQWGPVDIEFLASGEAKGTITFEAVLDSGQVLAITFSDTFYAFRSALQAFLDGIATKILPIARAETLTCMEIIALGKD